MSGSQDSEVKDTRAKLLALLCREDRTASELARELEISANAVRWHLQRLAEEGLVDRGVVRGGVGKPARTYHLTAEGSLRLSRAYLPMLSALLSVLLERENPGEEEALLREVGKMLARQHPRPKGALQDRVNAAVVILGEIGGIATVREEDGNLWIDGGCCPLRALVPNHPSACKAVEALLEEYMGIGVREQCEKHDPPTCRLAIGVA